MLPFLTRAEPNDGATAGAEVPSRRSRGRRLTKRGRAHRARPAEEWRTGFWRAAPTRIPRGRAEERGGYGLPLYSGPSRDPKLVVILSLPLVISGISVRYGRKWLRNLMGVLNSCQNGRNWRRILRLCGEFWPLPQKDATIWLTFPWKWQKCSRMPFLAFLAFPRIPKAIHWRFSSARKEFSALRRRIPAISWHSCKNRGSPPSQIRVPSGTRSWWWILTHSWHSQRECQETHMFCVPDSQKCQEMRSEA